MKAVKYVLLGGFIVLLLLGVVVLSQAFFKPKNFTTVSTMNQVIPILQMARTDTLVIFDIDGVLIEPENQVLQDVYASTLDAFEKDLYARHGENARRLMDIVWSQYTMSLIDKRLPGVIHELQARGVPVIAITNTFARGVDEVIDLSKLGQWRVNQIGQYGIDLRHAFPDLKPFEFWDMEMNGRFPAFRSGIIFTARQPKGEMLKALLKRTGYKPKRIIFIDDQWQNLEDVANVCKELGITFVGFEYDEVESRPRKPIHLERIKLQFDILERAHKWISDAEAGMLLNAQAPFSAQAA